jgi:hypothetical protein
MHRRHVAGIYLLLSVVTLRSKTFKIGGKEHAEICFCIFFILH